jgi:glycosyltransferase involved in cell wall biosynthesis
VNLAAVVLTYNEAHNIAACLESLAWTDRQVIFDGGPESGSSDGTVELAQRAGAEVLTHRFQNYAQQRNAAIERVEADWIFFVDADERATPALAIEVRHVIAERAEVGWSVPRHNMIFGRLTLGGGWYPDYQFRLFRRGYARWERPVHEVALVDGAQGRLENPLIHYNYTDLADFRRRQHRYNEFDARILHGQGVRPRLYTPYVQALRQFWWRFVTLRGACDGLHGLRLGWLMAYYELQKYRRLARLWR